MADFTGTPGDDILPGTAEKDDFDISQGGNDAVQGLDRDDVIRAGGAFTGADQIDGGTGSDTLRLNGDYSTAVVFSPSTLLNVERVVLEGGHSYALTLDDATAAAGATLDIQMNDHGANGDVTIHAEADTDSDIVVSSKLHAVTLYAGSGTMTLDGGAGGDHFYGGAGLGTAYGHCGADQFEGVAGAGNFFYGGKGDDLFYGGDGIGQLSGGAGDDVLVSDGHYDIDGGKGDDGVGVSGIVTDGSLHGGPGYDSLTLSGAIFDASHFNAKNSGFEYVEGLFGAVGTDKGNEVNFSGIDAEFLYFDGLAGDDKITGTDVNDWLAGDAGNDRLHGAGGADSMDGGTGHNSVHGGGGGDSIGIEVFADDLGGHNKFYGDAGDDELFGYDGTYRLYGGDGDDWIGFRNALVHSIDGGSGNDHLDLEFGGAVLDFSLLDAATTHIENLTGGAAAGSKAANVLDFSGFALATAEGVTIDGDRGGDTLIGTAAHDTLRGQEGDDRLVGGKGADFLVGGKGANIFGYAAVVESRGAAADTINQFDTGKDSIDLWFTVEGVDPRVSTGALNAASVNADLNAAIGAADLGAHHAVIFAPDSGDLAGSKVLVVDANGMAGYQHNADLVIFLDNTKHLNALDVGDFI